MLNRFQDVFKSLNDHDVKYVIIGGLAAILYGVPRVTFDLDILIEATRDNADRLLCAFLEAGMGSAALTSSDELLAHEITIFRDRVRIDVQTFTPGLSFETAWKNRNPISYQGQPIIVVSKQDLIAAKKGAGRRIDLEDVMLLESEADGVS